MGCGTCWLVVSKLLRVVMDLRKLLLRGCPIDDHKEATEIQKILMHKTQSFDVEVNFRKIWTLVHIYLRSDEFTTSFQTLIHFLKNKRQGRTRG